MMILKKKTLNKKKIIFEIRQHFVKLINLTQNKR